MFDTKERMKLKALIVESTGYYSDLLSTILSDIGVDCDVYASGKEALESKTKPEYAFIIVSRYLEDMGGELFLHRYREKYQLRDALTIMMSSDDVSKLMVDANKAGFKLVFDKKDIDSLHSFLIGVVNNRTLDLRANILYVEDQKSAAQMTIALLNSYEANVEHVTNMADAKAKFVEKNYDLVITDFYLQGNETGDDIIQLVRSINDADKANIPILVVSGETDQTKRTAFLRNGANDFIIKPYDDNELIVRSSNLVKNQKIHEQAKKQQEELIKLAMTDQLTGLYNRHSLFELAPKYISDANRHDFPISLLVIDLDFFKVVNDTHGHHIGDVVLKSVGKVLMDNCRAEDFVARFGGEEFVMLLSHCDFDFATIKAEAIRQAIEELKPQGLTITASIGAATLAADDDFEGLFEKADKAVYHAKEAGRNQVILYPCKFDTVI